jgi:tRNA (guanine37-N1)-methyltransferase
MWVGVVSLFPELVSMAASHGVLGRACDNNIVDLDLVNPRDFARDKHNTVDDRPYGGGPGMVMMVEPLTAAVTVARQRFVSRHPQRAPQDAPVIYLSPAGRRLDQQLVGELAQLPGMVLVAGRYEGVDQRFVDSQVDCELSVGDYVVSGGELPALLVLDAVARLLPGTLGNSASAIMESHLDGLLDYPHYTRPENQGGEVPEVLLSGDHAMISRWRTRQALLRTWKRRPDMLAGRTLSQLERELLAQAISEDDAAGAPAGGKQQ